MNEFVIFHVKGELNIMAVEALNVRKKIYISVKAPCPTKLKYKHKFSETIHK